jgi:hypothetical protein
MFRYHFVSVDANDDATTIQTIGCEDDSIALRQANNLLSLNHHCVEVWLDGELVHRVRHRRP